MRARVVLEDCRTALEWVEHATSNGEFRIRWVALVALLRTVGHVLDKVDGRSSDALRQAINARWDEWRKNRQENQVFWDFIEVERNSVLKTYEMGVECGDVGVLVQDRDNAEVFVLDRCLFTPLLIGPFEGEDGRDIARDAIDWWEEQLSLIASVAEDS